MTNKNEKWITIGKVGVDSGSLMIGDPCNLDRDWNEKLYDKWICEGLCNSKKGYIAINEKCANQAVAFLSGFGDGIYEVKALIKDYGKLGKRIKEVKIILIEDEEQKQ